MNRILQTLSQKWPEYLLEILVLIIGIYGAFALDEWKEESAKQKSEIALIKNLKKEFEGNLERFDAGFFKQKIRNNAVHILLSNEPESLGLERLDDLMDTIIWGQTFDPSMGVYNSVINSGKIDLISNEDLRIRLAGFESLFQDYREEEQLTYVYAQSKIEDFIVKSYPNRPLGKYRTVEEYPELFTELIGIAKSQEYRNLLILLDGYLISIMDEGALLRKEYIDIINDLNKELINFSQ